MEKQQVTDEDFIIVKSYKCIDDDVEVVDDCSPCESDSFRLVPSAAVIGLMSMFSSRESTNGSKSPSNIHSMSKLMYSSRRESQIMEEDFELVDTTDVIEGNPPMSLEELLQLINKVFESGDYELFRLSSVPKLLKTVFKMQIDPIL